MPATLRQALDAPIGIESLARLAFAGDRVALIPDPYFAEKPDILMEIVAELTPLGISKEDTVLLLTEQEEKTAAKIVEGTDLNYVIHRPGRRDRLALLGVNKTGEPVALCRELVDADLIISVEKFFFAKPKNYFGIGSAIFPRFADFASQQRLLGEKTGQRRQIKAEIAEVVEMLGIPFTVQFYQERGKTLEIVAGLEPHVREYFSKKNL